MSATRPEPRSRPAALRRVEERAPAGPARTGPADAWSPREVAARVETDGVAKARLDTVTLLLLAVLAGAFVSLGGLANLVAVTGSEMGFGPTRLVGGLAFSLGFVLVVVAGAELFTANDLVAMAWASQKIRTRELVRVWGLVYAGNVFGALATAALVAVACTDELGGGALGRTALAAAHDKVLLGPPEALARGVLCNALVCLAVWLAMGGRSVTDRILGVVFPITAFVALGFEHAVANWFFLSYAALLEGAGTSLWTGAAWNLVFVTLGNLIGGTLLVAAVYWTAWLRRAP